MDSISKELDVLEEKCKKGDFSLELRQSYELLNERYRALFPTRPFINCIGINNIKDQYSLVRSCINKRHYCINVQYFSMIAAMAAALARPMGLKTASSIAVIMILGFVGEWYYNPRTKIQKLGEEVSAAKERLKGIPK